MVDDDAKIDLGIVGLGPAEHIGRGGFADVYRAEQLSLRRTVAVKVLRAQATDADAEARFERECHAIGAVSDHPHIVGVHQGGFTRNGRAYLVMEYLPGGSLYDRLLDDGPMPVPEIVDIGIKIGKALAVAHRTGVLHRDVKPANIMISAYGEPALGDFGIARIEGGHQTASGMVTASFAHAAPEVLEGQPSTPAADIYSLGSTIFELMTGQPPYYDPNDESIWPLMKRILSEPMPTPESVGMSQQLGAVFRRATARDRGQRYAEADHLVEDLMAVANDPLAVMLLPPEGDRFVPAPRPSGQSAAAEESAPIGVPERIPPPATPDLTSVRPVDPDYTAPYAAPVEAVPDVPPDMRPAAGPGPDPEVVPTGVMADLDVGLRSFSTPDGPDGSGAWGRAELGDAAAAARSAEGSGVLGSADGSASAAMPATTMDLPPTLAVRQGPSGLRRVALPLVGLAAAVVALVGGFLFFGDGTDSLFGDSESPAAAEGDVAITLEAASVGPLLEGTFQEISAPDVPLGASAQLILDGLPTGDVVPVTADSPLGFETPAGRHSVAVEFMSGSERSVSNTMAFYGLPNDAPATGYRATLATVAIDDDSWSGTLALYDALAAEGHTNLELLVSDDFPALTPGYWIISVPGFGTDAEAVEAYCADFDLAVPSQCHVSFTNVGQ